MPSKRGSLRASRGDEDAASTSTHSFRAMRDALDVVRTRKPPRGSLRLRDYRDSEGESKENRGATAQLTPAQATAERAVLARCFPDACVDVRAFVGIDQGVDGACSLLALIHLIEIASAGRGGRSGAAAAPLLSRAPAALRAKDAWRAFWRPDLVNDERAAAVGVESLGATLDMSVMSGLLTPRGAAALRYVPVRSAANREQSFNERHWGAHSAAALGERYSVPPADVERVPCVSLSRPWNDKRRFPSRAGGGYVGRNRRVSTPS